MAAVGNLLASTKKVAGVVAVGGEIPEEENLDLSYTMEETPYAPAAVVSDRKQENGAVEYADDFELEDPAVQKFDSALAPKNGDSKEAIVDPVPPAAAPVPPKESIVDPPPVAQPQLPPPETDNDYSKAIFDPKSFRNIRFAVIVTTLIGIIGGFVFIRGKLKK